MTLVLNEDLDIGSLKFSDPYSAWYFNIGSKYRLSSKYEADDARVAVLTNFRDPPTLKPRAENSTRAQLFSIDGFTDGALPNLVSFSVPLSELQSEITSGNLFSLGNPSDMANDYLYRYSSADEKDRFLVQLPMPLPKDSIRIDIPEEEQESETVAPEPRQPNPDARSVTVVIDDAINFTHPKFRTGEQSRVDYAWIMDAPFGTNPVREVPHGREWYNDEINDLIALHGNSPNRLLREIGYADFTRSTYPAGARDVSHGTAVADIAVGDDPNDGNAQHHRIVFVGLPSIATEDTSGLSLAAPIMTAVDYGLRRAREIAGDRTDIPIVLNLSYAISAGPHDGSGLFERAIDALVQKYSKSEEDKAIHPYPYVVVPCGNDLQAQGHAVFEGSDEVDVDLTWVLPFSDRSSSFLEIWLEKGAEIKSFLITSPSGQTLPDNGAFEFPSIISRSGKPIARISVDVFSGRTRILVATIPSRVADGVTCPGGDWRIEAKIQKEGEQKVEAWIQRDAAPFGYRSRGVASFFRDKSYSRFNAKYSDGELASDLTRKDIEESHVKRKGAVSTVATAKSVIAVGAYFARSGDNLTFYSGQEDESHSILSYVFPGDTSRALSGIAAASSRGGSAVLSGTSISAPMLSRRIARQADVAHPLTIAASSHGVQVVPEDRMQHVLRKKPRCVDSGR